MSKSFSNAILVFASIISFTLSFIPQIDAQFRIILLVSAPIILSLACFYISLNKTDEMEKRVEKLEEKLQRAEDLISIKADIEYLKRK
ncbi:MAG: hypothetical protein AABX83_00945 [Nanoarchaeota archaeon]